MMLSVASLCTQLEDVNNAYSHDEIRFDGKHDELLTKFQTERTQDKTKYEVYFHCDVNCQGFLRI